MDGLQLGLTVARALHLAGVLSLAGALAFDLLVMPIIVPSAASRRLIGFSLTLAFFAGAVWLVLQSAAMSGASDVQGTLAALAPAALQTRFGTMLLLRAALLVIAGILVWRPRQGLRLAVAAFLSAIAVALQAALGHAAASGDPLLVGSLVLHLLAVALWLGGLPPLWIALAESDSPAIVARRFSVLGIVAVAVIAATALEQALALFGGFPGLIGTDYGHVGLVKLAFFLVLLCLAALNRLVFTPRMEADRDPALVQRMRVSVAVEAGLGLLVVFAAAALASLPPGMHVQPVWPFPLAPSLIALTDPDLRAEIVPALIAVAAAAALLLLAAIFRRWRLSLPALVAAALLLWFSAPHLEPLLVEAYPTSFYQSPTGFDAAGIAQGQTLFLANCAVCHGASGRGDGPMAAKLDIPPADLTADHLWDHADGELFWWLSHGIENPEGGLAMPGFAASLDEQERWALIDYIRAHNAALAMQGGHWTRPLQAPNLQADCPDGGEIDLFQLRGHILQITASGADQSLHVNGCIDNTQAAWNGYAIAANLAPSQLGGAVFIVDTQGWLRAVLTDPARAAIDAAVAQAAIPLPGRPRQMMMNMP